MNRISKLTLLSIVILAAVIYVGIANHLLAIILASISLVPLMRNIFEIRKYHNRNLFLVLSAAVLFIGIVSAGIWVLNQTILLYRAAIGAAAGLLIISTFQTAFSSTREWDEIRTH